MEATGTEIRRTIARKESGGELVQLPRLNKDDLCPAVPPPHHLITTNDKRSRDLYCYNENFKTNTDRCQRSQSTDASVLHGKVQVST
ncbi:unnamed protein product [Bursaphelenchus okinawaensis]|uniref:Uncharacterized protein n=1 Tax=Bursaphelenchus okinawaensis TaxID=465554 RepID=A0A811LM11_9BILA|nr:unnamed protein product [Bursaphelenchus okinawaensis]CAG9125876.1 unnamed protein product [Bursaphelenchus okinawaensis]